MPNMIDNPVSATASVSASGGRYPLSRHTVAQIRRCAQKRRHIADGHGGAERDPARPPPMSATRAWSCRTRGCQFGGAAPPPEGQGLGRIRTGVAVEYGNEDFPHLDDPFFGGRMDDGLPVLPEQGRVLRARPRRRASRPPRSLWCGL
jgi:hypothetical protein